MGSVAESVAAKIQSIFELCKLLRFFRERLRDNPTHSENTFFQPPCALALLLCAWRFFHNPRFVRYYESYYVPWLFLSTLMNFNLNPQTYDFTSSIPDVFEMSDFQGSSVYLAIYLNRSQSPIFSTTLYAHGGKASIYDLRSIIENYMEAKQLVHATCSFRMQVDRIDYTLGEFIKFKLQMLRTNCELFLQSHFLTTHAVRLVPHGFQLDLQYIVLPGETGQCATQYVIQRDDKNTPETLTISDTPLLPSCLILVSRISMKKNFWVTCPKG